MRRRPVRTLIARLDSVRRHIASHHCLTLALSHETPGAHMLDLMLWMPAEELARRRGVPVSDIVGMAMAGQIESCRQGDRWYVERPLVWLYYPDPTDVSHAELKVFALALGHYLTAARRMVTIPLRRADPDREESLETLCDALQGAPPEPVPFRLDGRDFLVDSSLHLDLATALVDFDARYDASLVAGLLADDIGPDTNTADS